MNKKAFTLIELLVVVAIIGILAAVGVVAYNGYTTSAKVSATKMNHSKVVTHVKSVIAQCKLDPSGKFDLGLNDETPCSNIYTSDATQLFVLWTQRNKMTNPYNGYGCCGHASNRDPYLGETYIAAEGTKIIKIKTRAKKGDPVIITTIDLI
jgi:type IV pilus assembly protein PilA